MPTKGADEKTLYIVGGNPFSIKSIESIRAFNKETGEEVLTFTGDECEKMLPCFIPSEPFTVTMKLKNTMNRVRFVRALIRLGYSKKEAKQIAKQTKKPYYIAWWDYFDKKEEERYEQTNGS